jgi:hypothetical protein
MSRKKADTLHSFVFHKDCTLFERRARYVLSCFSFAVSKGVLAMYHSLDAIRDMV